MDEVVIDASALVDLLLGHTLGLVVRRRLTGQVLHAPAHLDAEVLSALGRLHRAGELGTSHVEGQLTALALAPVQRHPVHELLGGAWARRHRLRLADALYVELATRLDCPLVTTDPRLKSVPAVEIVSS